MIAFLAVFIAAAMAAVIANTRDFSIIPSLADYKTSSQTPISSSGLAEAHPYFPPVDGDSRSPCPALNTLANHGYLPRDGRHIYSDNLYDALRKGFGLSRTLASILTYGSFILLRQIPPLSLDDISRHNCIEHDCSLAHDDTIPDHEYAPERVDPLLMDKFLSNSADGQNMTITDIARARVEREAAPQYRRSHFTLDALHAEIARGEMALVLGIFGGEEEMVPVDMLREWWTYDKFPEGWEPKKMQTLIKTAMTAFDIRTRMKAFRQELKRSR